MQTLWWIIFGFSVVMYISLAGFVFPKTFFKAGYDISFSYDRGLKKFKEKNGRSIVYEPKAEYRDCISQYILSERNGKKVIICKLKKDILYLDYDIVLFDFHEKVFKVINVKENIEKPGYTHIVELPDQTAYTTLIINNIDNVSFNNDAIKRLPKRRFAYFAAATGLLVALEIFLVKLCLANIYCDVFSNDFMTNTESILITFGVGIVAAAANLAFIFGYVIIKRQRQNREPGNYE